MGSTSGDVNYPIHIRMAHQDMLFADVNTAVQETFADADYKSSGDTITNYSVMADITAHRTGSGTNPHTNAEAYDPSTDLENVQGRSQIVHDFSDSLSPVSDISGYISSAESMVDQLLKFDDSKIDDAVNAFDAASKTRHRQRSTMVAAGLFDIRATMTSTFGQAMAMQEVERQHSVDQFEAQLRNGREDQRVNQRAGLIVDLVGKQMSVQNMKAQVLMQGAQQQEMASRNKIVASQDQVAFDLSREIDNELWDLNLYQHFNKAIGSVQGLAAGDVGPTQLERALSIGATGVSILGTLMSF